jgi:hypothetical protein
VGSIAPDEDDVRLDAVPLGEEHVEGAGEDLAEIVRLYEDEQPREQPAYDPLVTRGRPRGHDEPSVDDLVARAPLARQARELGVGPALAGALGLHGISLSHAS